MKRFLTVIILLLASLPVGVSLSGCASDVSHFCDASETVRTSQITSIVLQPQFSTLSLAYTQTRAMTSPAAYNCLGGGVSVRGYDWTSSNPSVLDVSPNGVLCSGTWNRNTGGGIGDFTICSAPSTATIESLLTQGNGSYSAFHVTITASANGVSSNPVTVYSHPQVTTAFGYTVPGNEGTQTACTNQYSIDCTGTASGTAPAPQCYSQQAMQAVTYCAVVCAEALGETGGVFSNQLVDVTGAAGDISFAASNIGVVTISPTTEAPAGVATPVAPGATLVTASVSGVTAAAGVWSTCAPATMQLSVPNSPDTTVNVPINQPQTLTLTATDSNNYPVNLSGLTFTSTTPRTLGITQSSTSSTGGIATPTFGGSGDVYAACLPPGCNPSPINDIGLFATATSGGNGVPLTSNPINVVTPGTETSIAYLANFDTVDYPNANYFAVYNSQENAISVASTVYRPNSMVLSQDGTRLYLGSDLGLMIYPVSGVTVGTVTVNQNVLGRVLAISPDGTTLVLASYTGNNPATGSPLIYVYTVTNGALQQFGGTAYSAQWSADGDTVYIAGGNQEYVYSKFTGFATYAAPASEANALDVAVLAPPVGAFFSGTNTEARSYCPNTTANPPVYNPLMTPTGQASERLGVSTDGLHLFSAVSATSGNFNDFCIGIPTTQGSTVTPACAPQPVAPLAACSPTFAVTATDTPATAAVLAGFNVTGIPVATTLVTPTQSNPCSTSNGQTNCITYTAFVTYSNCVNTLTFSESCPGSPAGTGALPYYVEPQGSAGTAGTLTLTNPGSAVAPVAPTAAAVSPDSTLAFVATSGDNALHIVNIGAGGVPTESVAANPPVAINLPSGNSTGYIPVDKIVIKPYRSN